MEKCEKCGRDFKNKTTLKNHQLTCKGILENTQEQVKQYTEEIDILTDKEKILVEVWEFYIALGGRMTASTYDINRMFGWYTALFGHSPGSSSCNPCITHCYNTLKVNIEQNIYLEKYARKQRKFK